MEKFHGQKATGKEGNILYIDKHAGLNRTSGIIVRNIYKPLIKPAASENSF